MNWTQVYDPLNSWPLSAPVAAIPIAVFFYLLAVRGTKPHWAAMISAITATLLASAVFTMPLSMSAMSFAFGAAFGLKIAWIVIAAVFLYDISVFTGQFEIMKNSVAAISQDRRLQALLVAFAFGAFVEGCAGFGAPVGISGAFMIGLGFAPFYAALLDLSECRSTRTISPARAVIARATSSGSPSRARSLRDGPGRCSTTESTATN